MSSNSILGEGSVLGEIKKDSAIIVDFQTTGSSPDSSHIIELGYSIFNPQDDKDNQMETSIASLPCDVDISKRITNLTGISKEMIEEASSTAKEIFDSWQIEQHKKPLIIHYAQFETPFIKTLMDQLPPIICTHKIAKRLFPALPSKSLRGVSGYLGYPIGELKRSADHIAASRFIWSKLQPILVEKGLDTYDKILDWLKSSKAPKAKREFSISREKRLALPDHPGIYKMLDENGSILYIGKAKSLKNRVNSYFRGIKTKGSRLNEMLSQVKDISTEKAMSPCHAALIEADLIKEHHPPYNRALKKAEELKPFFCNDDLNPQTIGSYGPFRSENFLAHIKNLKDLVLGNLDHLNDDHWNIDQQTLLGGVRLFHERYVDVEKDDFSWPQIVRELWEESINRRRQKILDKKQGLIGEAEPNEEESDQYLDEVEWTEDDVFVHIKKSIAHLGHRIHRGALIKKLANCQISYLEKGSLEHIVVRNGKTFFYNEKSFCQSRVEKSEPLKTLDDYLDLECYDRLNTLLIELRRIHNESETISIQYGSHRTFRNRDITVRFFPELVLAED